MAALGFSSGFSTQGSLPSDPLEKTYNIKRFKVLHSEVLPGYFLMLLMKNCLQYFS